MWYIRKKQALLHNGRIFWIIYKYCFPSSSFSSPFFFYFCEVKNIRYEFVWIFSFWLLSVGLRFVVVRICQSFFSASMWFCQLRFYLYACVKSFFPQSLALFLSVFFFVVVAVSHLHNYVHRFDHSPDWIWDFRLDFFCCCNIYSLIFMQCILFCLVVGFVVHSGLSWQRFSHCSTRIHGKSRNFDIL